LLDILPAAREVIGPSRTVSVVTVFFDARGGFSTPSPADRTAELVVFLGPEFAALPSAEFLGGDPVEIGRLLDTAVRNQPPLGFTFSKRIVGILRQELPEYFFTEWGRRDLNPRSTDISGRASVLQRVVVARR